MLHETKTQRKKNMPKVCAVNAKYLYYCVPEIHMISSSGKNLKVKKVTTKETTGQCQVKGHKTNEKHNKWLTH